ncbi:type II transport protein GspH [Catenovulum sp. SM1970]|uniref:GspH/FimT family pseudopilin n=1 Tax=Marinifaba aquimaris TaxID=2741323 RepID=UPI00157352A2|nr:GspH/FimT family pseudopilin [Marinifaba aquimaris]NTS76717.1 type II transport protein GspH [Marinifaba aquimaris]
MLSSLNRKSQKGFNVLELMVAVAITGLTLTLGVPSMSETYADIRVNNTVRQVSKDLVYARTYAISNNTVVTICNLSGSSCTGSWEDGYTIFIDGDASGTFDTANDLKLVENADLAFGELKLSISDSALQYRMNGSVNKEANFTFCPHSEQGKAKGIIINKMGRTKLTEDYDGDGLDEISVTDMDSHISCSAT